MACGNQRLFVALTFMAYWELFLRNSLLGHKPDLL